MWGYNENFYGSICESSRKDGQREWLLKKKKRESGHKLVRDTISTITQTNDHGILTPLPQYWEIPSILVLID